MGAGDLCTLPALSPRSPSLPGAGLVKQRLLQPYAYASSPGGEPRASVELCDLGELT